MELHMSASSAEHLSAPPPPPPHSIFLPILVATEASLVFVQIECLQGSGCGAVETVSSSQGYKVTKP